MWEYQWSNFIYNCMSTFLHYVHCKDALLDCSAPGGERCESLTWVDEIVTSSICEPLAIVTSHWSIILTLYLWSLSSSQWRCQPGRFSMAAHRHDRRGIYRCVLLRFRGRIEIDHSYGLRCRGLCCHSRHSTRGAGRRDRTTAGSTRAVPGVSAQTIPAQTVPWSIPISYNGWLAICDCQGSILSWKW